MGISVSQIDKYVKTEEGKEVEEYLVNKVVNKLGYSYFQILNVYFNKDNTLITYHLYTDNGLTLILYKTKEDAIKQNYRLVEIDTV